MVLHCILHGIITFNFITFQWLATGQVFSPGTPVSSTNKTDRHDIYNWNNVESGVKHHKPITCLFVLTFPPLCLVYSFSRMRVNVKFLPLMFCTGARGTELPPPPFFLLSVYISIFNKISLFLYYFISFSLF